MRWLLLLVPMLAWGQVGVPVQTGDNEKCIAKVHSPAQIDSCLFVYSIVQPNNPDPFHWGTFGVLDNFANDGESTAFYYKARQWGRGATWSGVLESQCITPLGANSCWGLEVDLMAPPDGERRGYGVGLFIGRANAETPLRDPDDHRVSHALAGFFVDENANDAGYVDIAVAYDSQIHCTVACFRLRGGESFAWELTGSVVTKLDPITGYWGLWRGNKCVVCWNADTGDEKHNWTP